ncbi:UbiA family prenyltransferase [Mucilaginibacter ginkgonis]|uniref:UbiA family prenyltransferase n=1 Tax=Mucilaginibacter ginkgonis TaxID=2682091 RepID=A0A6I4INZ2_9SPHI|nr:UbiA family prenyltransferase [Mucilaginibacter ginkgonis]QQL48305.1 UbiA family prenyltransferase [Mucilaginibacter ginkgonis]
MSLCAVAQGLVTFHLIGSAPIYPPLIILFMATLGVYNFSTLITRPKNPTSSKHYRVRWFYTHYKLNLVLTVIAFASLFPLFFLVSLGSKLLLMFMTVLSIGYGLPLFKIGDKKFGLRQIPGLKPFLITLVWSMSGVLVPVLEAADQHLTTINLRDIAILFAKRFLFIAALTIPYDIRDMDDDKAASLKTIPVTLGEKNAYNLCQLLLGGYLVLLFLFRNNGFNMDFLALALVAILTGWLIFRSKWDKNELYYFFYMDGVLILQYVLLIIFDGISRFA